jgi:ketosteroid isomerase-like protein
MSQENVDAYERAVEASNRQDLDAMLEEFDPEVEWYPAVVGMGSEVYRGADGIRELFGDMGETIPDAFFEVSEVRDLGDRLLSFGHLHAHGRQSSAPTEVPFAQLVHFREGKATVLRTFLDPKVALEAAGLSDSGDAKESTTPDSVELVRLQVEALDRGDLDGVMRNVSEDGVLEARTESLEGRAAIRGFLEDWFRAYEDLDFSLEEVSHLGGGVVFAVVIQDGRLVGADGRLRQREGWVYLCVGGSIARLTTSDVDQARAGSERLAQERG